NQVTPYEIPPIGPRPLVEPPLQDDDSRVRGLRGQRGGLSAKLIGRRTSTRTARPCVRPGRNRAPSTYARAAPSKPTCELSSTRDRGSGRPSVSITIWTTTVPVVPVRRSMSGSPSGGPASSTGGSFTAIGLHGPSGAPSTPWSPTASRPPRNSTLGSNGARASIGGSPMGACGGTSIGGATGPGTGSNPFTTFDPSSEGCGHEMRIGGPSTPATW